MTQSDLGTLSMLEGAYLFSALFEEYLLDDFVDAPGW
jgi:hypothetical protein